MGYDVLKGLQQKITFPSTHERRTTVTVTHEPLLLASRQMIQ